MDSPLPEPEVFVDAGKAIVENVFQTVKEFYEQDRQGVEVEGGKHKDRNNLTREIDKLAQRDAENQIKRLEALRRLKILILGEEKKRYPVSLERCKRIVAFVDPVDGTDLVARGFGNWCLALLFFYPPQRRILASVIGHSSGEVYWATEKEVKRETERINMYPDGGTIRKDHQNLNRNVGEDIHLQDAGVCFYGQKPKSFLAFAESPGLMEALRDFRSRMQRKGSRPGERIDMRLYNFGGNPMMAKLANGDIDAVLGLHPQEVHDVLPGAYVATRAGAIFTTLRNTKIDLERQLLKPREKLTYILSASRSLHFDLHQLVSSKPV
jgi:fructose-1,6-bisphosphatase/inositol monophosphatase family enzyme